MPRHDLHEHITKTAEDAAAEEGGDPKKSGDPTQRDKAADLLTRRYVTAASDATYVHHDPVMLYDPNRSDVGGVGKARRFPGTPFVRGEDGKGHKDASAVDPNDVRQGAVGDCWLMSALIAVARANPRAIESLIRDLGGGRYEVTLYLGAETKVGDRISRAPVKIIVNDVFPVEKDGKTARYADPADRDSGGSELWVMLIEKAYAKHMGGYEGQAYLGRGLTARFESAIEELLPEGTMAGIPLSTSVVKDIFGNPIDNAIRNEATQKFTQHPELLCTYLQKCLDQHRPVTAMTKVDVEQTESALAKKWGVPNWHHYALMSVDLANRTLCWQNPWGSSHVMNIPVSEFLQLYAHVQVGPSLTGPVDSMPTQKDRPNVG